MLSAVSTSPRKWESVFVGNSTTLTLDISTGQVMMEYSLVTSPIKSEQLKFMATVGGYIEKIRGHYVYFMSSKLQQIFFHRCIVDPFVKDIPTT
jgi:hypothetical protein